MVCIISYKPFDLLVPKWIISSIHKFINRFFLLLQDRGNLIIYNPTPQIINTMLRGLRGLRFLSASSTALTSLAVIGRRHRPNTPSLTPLLKDCHGYFLLFSAHVFFFDFLFIVLDTSQQMLLISRSHILPFSVDCHIAILMTYWGSSFAISWRSII